MPQRKLRRFDGISSAGLSRLRVRSHRAAAADAASAAAFPRTIVPLPKLAVKTLIAETWIVRLNDSEITPPCALGAKFDSALPLQDSPLMHPAFAEEKLAGTGDSCAAAPVADVPTSRSPERSSAPENRSSARCTVGSSAAAPTPPNHTASPSARDMQMPRIIFRPARLVAPDQIIIAPFGGKRNGANGRDSNRRDCPVRWSSLVSRYPARLEQGDR